MCTFVSTKQRYCYSAVSNSTMSRLAINAIQSKPLSCFESKNSNLKEDVCTVIADFFRLPAPQPKVVWRSLGTRVECGRAHGKIVWKGGSSQILTRKMTKGGRRFPSAVADKITVQWLDSIPGCLEIVWVKVIRFLFHLKHSWKDSKKHRKNLKSSE